MTPEQNAAPAIVTVTRGRGERVNVDCTCGWFASYSTRTIEGHSLARRDADAHVWAHRHGHGWFHPLEGWQVNPTPCDCHYTTAFDTRAAVGVTR